MFIRAMNHIRCASKYTAGLNATQCFILFNFFGELGLFVLCLTINSTPLEWTRHPFHRETRRNICLLCSLDFFIGANRGKKIRTQALLRRCPRDWCWEKCCSVLNAPVFHSLNTETSFFSAVLQDTVYHEPFPHMSSAHGSSIKVGEEEKKKSIEPCLLEHFVLCLCFLTVFSKVNYHYCWY